MQSLRYQKLAKVWHAESKNHELKKNRDGEKRNDGTSRNGGRENFRKT